MPLDAKPTYVAVEADTLPNLAAALNEMGVGGRNYDTIFQPEYVAGRWQIMVVAYEVEELPLTAQQSIEAELALLVDRIASLEEWRQQVTDDALDGELEA